MSRKRPRENIQEKIMAQSLDALAEFQEFRDNLMPFLRRALKEGWTAEQIEDHPAIKAALVARQLSIALNDADAGKALAAIRDTRDRKEGKAKERLELSGKLEKAADETLDALIKSKLAAASEDEDEESVSLPS